MWWSAFFFSGTDHILQTGSLCCDNFSKLLHAGHHSEKCNLDHIEHKQLNSWDADVIPRRWQMQQLLFCEFVILFVSRYLLDEQFC
jgi:hypothetical protein